MDRKPVYVKLHYPGWSSTYDEWVPVGKDDPASIVVKVPRTKVESAFEERSFVLFCDVVS